MTEPDDVEGDDDDPRAGARKLVGDAIQASVVTNDELEGAVLLNWVTIAEFAAPDGARWMSALSGDALGERPPTWTVRGLLHEALFEPAD